MAGTASRSPTRGSGQRDLVDQHVAALAVAADHGHGLAGVRGDAVGDGGLEALAEQRHLEVVAHPAVDGDERARPALDGQHAVERHRRGGDHAAAGLDDQLRARPEVLARGADERVEIGADGRRLVGVGVARAEAAAEVVDRELAERGDRRDRLRERLDVEDLRSHVDVQPPHAQARAVLDPPDQLPRRPSAPARTSIPRAR